MEIGPTCHYVMGGVEVDPDTQMSRVQGLYAAGEVAGGMHGANRLGGNSLGDLLVFGKRAGEHAASYAAGTAANRPAVAEADVKAAGDAALAPFSREGGENAYTVHRDLQDTMHNLVGIIRTAEEMSQALEKIEEFKTRVAHVSVEGHRQYNPGWHLSIDLKNMLLVSESIARAALDRKESRGGHTRDDYPATDPSWGQINVLVRLNSDRTGVEVFHQDLPQMPDELKKLFDDGSH
jgi:succinate dehydrogenase / fumarate reductase flavoprotein subunit